MPDKDKEWNVRVAEGGRIAPNTEEGRKTLEQRDEWFRFMFKFMTAGDVPANEFGWFFMICPLFIEICKGFLPTRLGHRKFSTKEKLEEFVKSFGDGDYYSGLRYVEIMLTGGLR